MERKVGHQFKEGDTLLEVVEASGCDKCFYFHHKSSSCNRVMEIAGQCGIGFRSDLKPVQFRVSKPNIETIIDRNYKATVKRGLITRETTIIDFYKKLQEETNELLASYLISPINDFDPKELADIALVCFAMAKHFNIDLLKVMEEKTLYNETRED